MTFMRCPSLVSRDLGGRQQFCGQADTTFPSGNVTIRMSPEEDLSRARLASAGTVFPTAASKSALPTSRVLKKLGDGPSSCHVSNLPEAFLTSMVKPMCGFLQSTFVKVPVNVTLSFRSNMAVMLWCAAATLMSKTARAAKRATENLGLSVMRMLLVGDAPTS